MKTDKLTHYETNLFPETKLLNEMLKNRGFSVEVLEAGTGTETTFGKTRVVHRFKIRLNKDGKPVLETPYSMGTGSLDLGAVRDSDFLYVANGQNQATLARTWKVKRHAEFTDIILWSETAETIRKKQGVIPALADVFNSLLLDGSAFFDGETFEDWCENYGYNSDSITALGMYRQCDRSGRELARVLSADELEKMRELFAEY